MTVKQSSAHSVDISQNLRELMNVHRLTVADLARRVGVSKSAMEKYLAGPSSPRASTIRTICLEFGVDAEWLLFGYNLPLTRTLMSASYSAFLALMDELKQPGSFSEEFMTTEFGSAAWRQFVLHIATERAEELTEYVCKRVSEDQASLRSGLQQARGEPREVLGIDADETNAKAR